MKKFITIILILTVSIMYQLYVYGYMPGHILHTDKPGYQTENNSNRQNIKPIPFTPAITATADIPDDELIGYFWDSIDTDPTLLYPGKARIGNDQYINVVAVDSKLIDLKDVNQQETSALSSEDILNPHKKTSKFDPGALIYLGTFMKKNDPVVYYVYGEYLSTIVPEPQGVENL